MGIITKQIGDYKIYTLDDTPVEKILNPIKSANVHEPQISSWARLYQLSHESDLGIIKSASTEHVISSWARLHKLANP
jgi:hypothetical protein